VRDSHRDRKSDRKQRQHKSGSGPEPAADHLAARTHSIELSVFIHLHDLQEAFGLAGPELPPQQPGSGTAVAAVIAPIAPVIAPALPPVTSVIAPIATPLATSEKAGSVSSFSEQWHLHAP
jgi:hypothetical protein